MEQKKERFIDKLLVLKGTPRELWIVYAVNVTEYVAYTLMQFSLMLWLISDMGLTDANAAWTIGIWSMILSAIMSVSGMVTDGLGIKRSLLLGYAICVVGRLAIAFNIPVLAAIVVGLGPIAIGMALMVPVSTAAVRRYSSPTQRSMAFSLFYVLFNVGYAIGGLAWDRIRQKVQDMGGQVTLFGYPMSDHQFNFFVSTMITILGVAMIAFLIRPGINASGEQTEKTEKVENPVKIFVEVVREKKFWVFIFFMLIVVGAKSVFYHMHYTLPPFAERYIGQGAKIGTAWGALNPLLIVIIVPFIAAWTQKISSFRMVLVGTTICAFSSFILCIPGEWFADIANWGPINSFLMWSLGIKYSIIDPWGLGAQGPAFLHPWYIPLILFVIIFTIGEAIWSPRLMQYTAAIAPKDRVGSYMSLSVLPWFASKPLVAALMAWILPSYAPPEGPIQPFMFWLLVAITAMSTPILLFTFKGFIRKIAEADSDKEEAKA